jgi:2-oxoglutarate ferredoxin oxidoreductase subunit alpha
MSRVLASTVEQARAEGIKLGLLRPISLWPFPTKTIQKYRDQAKFFLAAELSIGMMVDDLRLALECRKPVFYYGRYGGNTPTPEEVLEEVKRLYKEVQ